MVYTTTKNTKKTQREIIAKIKIHALLFIMITYLSIFFNL